MDMETINPNNVIEPEVKKKRGRKPKEAKVEVISTKVNIIDSFNVSSSSKQDNEKHVVDTGKVQETCCADVKETIDDVKKNDGVGDDTPVKKGKRGRKPKYVYSSYDVTTVNDESANTSNQIVDDENVIVRLNISSDVLTNEMANVVSSSNNEEHPYAYNHDTYSNISNINDVLSSQPDTIIEKKNKNEGNPKVVNVLNEFAEKNKNNEWPLNTSISCYWCVHRFDNAPFGIPINYKKETFEVFGCFCSLECAAAYNFSENKSQDEMWERYQLINLMSRRMKLGNLVKCSPPRLSLKIFGGNMDIEAFRNLGKTNKILNVNFPPMSSITQQLEEINDFEINNDFKYIPVDDDRVNKYKEKIIFKRSKPLIDKNKSLESSMNLKYVSTS
jgi:hypothetical protein